MTPWTRATLIIPIFHQTQWLLRLWTTLERFTSPEQVDQVIWINDSPNDPQIEEACQHILANSYFSNIYLKNEYNQGFVSSCNRGLLEKNASSHALLINTDVLLQEQWLQKILHCYQCATQSGLKVASITPLTNHGTLATVPFLNQSTSFTGIHSPQAANRLAGMLYGSHDRSFQVPVGVGFCLLMTAEAIETIGFLNEIFSPGYGEEVDWCLRAQDAGFVSLLDPATFVYHQGGSSFGSQKDGLSFQHEAKIIAKYPDYSEKIRHYFQNIESKTMRQIFQWYHELIQKISFHTISIHVTTLNPFHAVGGIEKCLLDWAQQGIHQSRGSWILCRENTQEFQHYCVVNEVGQILMRGRLPQILACWKVLESCWNLIFLEGAIHHWMRWKTEDVFTLLPFLRERTQDLSHYFHDYFLLSPYPDLYCSHRQQSPEIPHPDAWCAHCEEEPSLQQHRSFFQRTLDYMDRVIFPSETAENLFLQIIDPKPYRFQCVTRPHATIRWTSELRPMIRRKTRFKFAFLGYGRMAKGSHIFLELAQKHGDRFSFVFLGNHDELRRNPVIRQVRYRFQQQSPIELLLQEQPDAVLLLSLYPETFGWTLHEAIEARIPVLTLASSGNIAQIVDQWKIGSVFSDVEHLNEWLSLSQSQMQDGIDLWQERLRHLAVMPNTVK